MFNKFTTIIQQAVDALAPDTPLHEDFVYHWKSITNFYIENTDDKTPVTDSNIPSHLKQMLQILIQEEDEKGGDTGPCMEYLLQHKILETLHTLGRADCPPGMKQQILIFFKNLLGKIRQPLLPHVNVHRPVARLVKICGEVQAAPTETEEISFLCTVCARLKREPHLVHLFLQGSLENPVVGNDVNKTNANENSTKLSTGDTPTSSNKEKYDLVDSLLNLSRSEDGRVAVKACEGLLLLVSIPHPDAANATVRGTKLCPLLNTRLISLFKLLPNTLDPSDVELITAKWGLDSHSYSCSDSRNFTGKRALVSFLSWFDYCDQLVMDAYQDCGQFIASSIAQHFFKEVLLEPLLQADERASLTTTAVLSKLFGMVRSKHLIREMVNFIVPEKSTDQTKQESEPNLLGRLLERCDHFTDEISVVTLGLFETILNKKDPVILDRLVLQYLKDRGYHAKNPGNVVIQSDSEELEWDLEPGLESNTPNSPKRTKHHSNSELLDGGGDASNPRVHIQRTVNKYLTAMPDSAKSTQPNDDDSGYDGYLREAHRMYKEVCNTCKLFNWPPFNTDCIESPERCSPVANYDEGPFLRMLFNKLKNVLSQPYAVNLVVTSIASKFTLLPHPLLHELLLDPLTPIRPKATSVYSVIQGVVEQVTHRMSHVTNFKARLMSARKNLASSSEDSPTHQKGTAMAQNLSSGGGISLIGTNDDHRTFLEGSIVLEEFCKELAAIAFVKHHAMTIRGL